MNPVGTKIGMPSDYAADGLHMLPGQAFLIGRDANGLYALTSVCSHANCDLNSMGAILTAGGQDVGILCNCHGSKFDNNGFVVQGPAIAPLDHVALALGCDGFLYVDDNTVVSFFARLPA
jgi:Rieske Fe-S protein